MKRVLHVFKDAHPRRGGIEQHIFDLTNGVDRWEHTVLTSSRSRRMIDETIDGVRYIRTPEYARPTSTPITPHWIRILRDPPADLVHLHMPNPFGELAWLLSRSRTPMVATWHAEIIGRRLVKPLFAPFQQRVLRQAQKILVSSPRLAETTSELHGHPVTVVPFGIDPPPDVAPIDLPHPLVSFIGRRAYYKGLDVLKQAMPRINATLAVIGDGELPLPAGAIDLGPAPDETKWALLRAADVHLAPSTSRAETFGMSILEAMACGTPVVSTELGTGTSWVNQHNQTGMVVPPNDPAELAEAVNHLLDDDTLRANLGAAAADRARTHFSKTGMLDDVRAIYDDVCPPS